MIRSAVTISVVEQARGGPFVFWDGIVDGCTRAAELGFDAVEIFSPSPEALAAINLQKVLDEHHLGLAAVGTGGGMVIHGLTLCDSDASRRGAATDFVRSIIDMGASLGAPAIIGSIQGQWGGELDRETGLDLLREGLDELGTHAQQQGVPLIYEPLNRYETNLINTIADGVALIDSLCTDNVRLLADLFHMNIEEVDIADALRSGGSHIGHVHFVDSNRRAAGMGHMAYEPIAAALAKIGYDGYVSAEVFALPTSQAAARQTIASFHKHFR